VRVLGVNRKAGTLDAQTINTILILHFIFLKKISKYALRTFDAFDQKLCEIYITKQTMNFSKINMQIYESPCSC